MNALSSLPSDVVSILVYAAALNLYRGANNGEGMGWRALDRKGIGSAVLNVAAWENRPSCLADEGGSK